MCPLANRGKFFWRIILLSRTLYLKKPNLLIQAYMLADFWDYGTECGVADGSQIFDSAYSTVRGVPQLSAFYLITSSP